ncbi:MAG: hypothetical protein IJR94_01995 [Synergistaceae bacterium]|nr:hypothetical protein [Synergistaceae bacterium]
MESHDSKVKALRVRREDIPHFGKGKELSTRGIYFLLMEKDNIYVGQTSNLLDNRMFAPHTGNIDSRWHTVIAFAFPDWIDDSQLRFIENAMCEHVYKKYGHCETSSPARENCNEAYRKKIYPFGIAHLHLCQSYLEDMEFYLETFERLGGLFGEISIPPQPPEENNLQPEEEFYFKNSSRDAEGTLIITSDTPRNFILKAGSKISDGLLEWRGRDSVLQQRAQFEAEGKLLNRVLTSDEYFKSPHAAVEFLNGGSINALIYWKNKNGLTLGEVLKSQKDS